MQTSVVILLTAGIVSLIFGVILFLMIKSIRSKIDGYLEVSARDASLIYKLDLDTEPEDLKKQDYVLLKVRQIPDL